MGAIECMADDTPNAGHSRAHLLSFRTPCHPPPHHHHVSTTQAPGQPPITDYRVPVLAEKDGFISSCVVPEYIDMAEVSLGQPLPAKDREALAFFLETGLSRDLRLDLMMEPGDLVLANNRSILHSRTEFHDGCCWWLLPIHPSFHPSLTPFHSFPCSLSNSPVFSVTCSPSPLVVKSARTHRCIYNIRYILSPQSKKKNTLFPLKCVHVHPMPYALYLQTLWIRKTSDICSGCG